MDVIQRFGEYAAAFEKVYENDDWSLLEPYFTEDAAYEIHAEPPMGGRHEGRSNVFAALKQAVDGFDRRFDVRELELVQGPEIRDGAVWMSWAVTYRHPGVPDLRFEGEETARFEGDRIVLLEDHFAEGMGNAAASYFAEHGEKLKPASA